MDTHLVNFLGSQRRCDRTLGQAQACQGAVYHHTWHSAWLWRARSSPRRPPSPLCRVLKAWCVMSVQSRFSINHKFGRGLLSALSLTVICEWTHQSASKQREALNGAAARHWPPGHHVGALGYAHDQQIIGEYGATAGAGLLEPVLLALTWRFCKLLAWCSSCRDHRMPSV